ncbi:MAG: LacI family DNA-binding transcriptional regulator [Phycisphaerales bacterium]
MATIREIAKLSGVSASTASRVLAGGSARSLCNEQTAIHVEQVARQLGFRANYHMRSMRIGRSFAIGFSMDFRRQERAGQVGSWYFDQIREGVEAAAQEAGMNLMIVRPDAESSAWDRGLNYLRDRRLDALIVPGAAAAAASVQPQPGAKAMNIVTVDGAATGFPHVGFDEPMGLAMIAHHLRELGHERVIWFGPDIRHNGSGVSREQAFLREAFSVGLTGHVCLMDDVTSQGVATIDPVLSGTQAGLAAYLRESDPRPFTAVVCYNDFFALGAQRALIAAGYRVPPDVSVVGFDDSWAAFGYPPITTVSHQLFEMGKQAGQMAIAAIDTVEERGGRSDDADQVASRVVSPRFVIRASTCRAAAAPAS